MKPPILIFGVPRSGTTLLRTILDCHPAIACGPEAPWLAHQYGSVRGFFRELTEGEFNFSKNFGVPQEKVVARVRQLVDGLFTDFAETQGKQRWAHKTPDDAMFVEFFTELFPSAKFLHIARDPLDVALSTAKIPEHRKGVSAWHENNLVIEEGCAIRNTLFNATLRWRRWNDKITAGLRGRDCLQVKYEKIVSDPRNEFARIFTFLGEPFDESILNYQNFRSILPSWEWGSADVKRAQSINTGSVGRWKKELSGEQAAALALLSDEGSSRLEPAPHPATTLTKDARAVLVEGINDLASSFGLTPMHAGAVAPEWFLRHCRHLKQSMVAVLEIGRGDSVWPWFLAMLGARVTFMCSQPEQFDRWQNLKKQLHVDINWIDLGPSQSTTGLPGQSAEVVFLTDPTLIATITASGARPSVESGMNLDLEEIRRLLAPGGVLYIESPDEISTRRITAGFRAKPEFTVQSESGHVLVTNARPSMVKGSA